VKYRLLINGHWVESGPAFEGKKRYSGKTIDALSIPRHVKVGRECVKFAMEEMTKILVVAVRLNS
jgi:hypothetical protein